MAYLNTWPINWYDRARRGRPCIRLRSGPSRNAVTAGGQVVKHANWTRCGTVFAPSWRAVGDRLPRRPQLLCILHRENHRHRFIPAFNTKFLDLVHVKLHRAVAYSQVTCHFLVAQTASNEHYDLIFALRQPIRSVDFGFGHWRKDKGPTLVVGAKGQPG